MTQATYSQLDQVLSSLGFSVRVVTIENKLRVYEHNQSGARLSLAFRPDDDLVLPHHLAAVQGTLKLFGIADFPGRHQGDFWGPWVIVLAHAAAGAIATVVVLARTGGKRT